MSEGRKLNSLTSLRFIAAALIVVPRDWDDRRLLFPIPKTNRGNITSIHLDGFFEAANCEQIIGWAWDSKNHKRQLTVEILEGDQALASVNAGDFRADLLQAKIGDGKHAFCIPTPAQLKDGKPHAIHVRVAGVRFELKGSPKKSNA